VVTRRLAATLIATIRPDLAKAVGNLNFWSTKQSHKALKGLKNALDDFRGTPEFWTLAGGAS
jgi:hypothetical protein